MLLLIEVALIRGDDEVTGREGDLVVTLVSGTLMLTVDEVAASELSVLLLMTLDTFSCLLRVVVDLMVLVLSIGELVLVVAAAAAVVTLIT